MGRFKELWAEEVDSAEPCPSDFDTVEDAEKYFGPMKQKKHVRRESTVSNDQTIKERELVSYMKGNKPTHDGICWLYEMLLEVEEGQQDYEVWDEVTDGQEQRGDLVRWLSKLLDKEVDKKKKKKRRTK